MLHYQVKYGCMVPKYLCEPTQVEIFVPVLVLKMKAWIVYQIDKLHGHDQN